jgi:uncharacterized phage protein (TIGR02218 family)
MSGAVIPSWLTAPVVPLAWCWRIERRDGVTLGLTTHDRDLMIGSLRYRAAPGIRPSAIRQAMGLDGDRMDIEGALTADALSAAELTSGRWNGARLALLVADWENPDTHHIVIAEGRLGEVAVQGHSFSAELRGGQAWLEQAVAPATSAGCRADLGDRRCGVALAGLTVRRTVTAAAGQIVTVADAPAGLAHGRLRWLDGTMRGQWAVIIGQAGDALTLADAMPIGVSAGLVVELVAGCDKRAETCRTRFGNMANFRGEPHLPGTDLLTRYPGG